MTSQIFYDCQPPGNVNDEVFYTIELFIKHKESE